VRSASGVEQWMQEKKRNTIIKDKGQKPHYITITLGRNISEIKYNYYP